MTTAHDCSRSAQLFRATTQRRDDAADIHAIRRLADWGESICRRGVATLDFAISATGATRTLHLVPNDRPTGLVSIVNDDRGHRPGRHVYLYSFANVEQRAPTAAARIRSLMDEILGEAELKREVAGSEASDALLEAWTAALEEASAHGSSSA